MPIPFYIYCIGFSLLVGIINYRWLKLSRLKAFVPFLVLTLIFELLGVYTKYVLNIPNGVLYNFYTWIQVAFLCFYYRGFQMKLIYRRIISVALVCYTLATVYMYGFVWPITQFSIELFLTGGFLVVVSGIFFLFNYFSLDDTSQELNLGPVIYVTVGVISYFTVLSITVSLYKFILFYDLKIAGIHLHNILPRIMSVIMYLFFAYSFYKCRRINLK